MSEQSGNSVNRLALKDLSVGDVLRVTTGQGETAYHYSFSIEQPGEWPTGQLEELRPDGSRTGLMRAILHGSGRWTSRRQNPVQKQERAFTASWGELLVGDFLVIADPKATPGDRLIFDKLAQEISQMVVEK